MKQMTNQNRVTYLDCILGKTGFPTDKTAKNLFQILMVGSMVICMVTFNWFIHVDSISLASWVSSLYEYPMMFCVAMIVRIFVGNPIVNTIVGKLHIVQLGALKRSIGMTATNVFVMATLMGFFGLLIAGGGLTFTVTDYLALLPVTYVAAFTINYFLASPFVRTVFARLVEPKLAARTQKAASNATPIAEATAFKPLTPKTGNTDIS